MEYRYQEFQELVDKWMGAYRGTLTSAEDCYFLSRQAYEDAEHIYMESLSFLKDFDFGLDEEENDSICKCYKPQVFTFRKDRQIHELFKVSKEEIQAKKEVILQVLNCY